MSWLRIDDGFISHRKIAALSDAELRLWLRVLCFSAAHRRQRNGRISRQDRREISGFSETKSRRFQALGLLDPTEELGTVEVHDFERYNPVDKTATERKQRERARKAETLDPPRNEEDVTRDALRDTDSDNPRDPRARTRSRTPTPDLNTAAAGSTHAADPTPEPAAAALFERLDDLGLNGDARTIALDQPDRATAWLNLAATDATTNPAGYVLAGLRSGQWPAPRQTAAPKTVTAHDRAVHRARLLIEAGEWDHLLPHLLQVELDDLGIAHADRGPLERLWESRAERDFRETDVASDHGPR